MAHIADLHLLRREVEGYLRGISCGCSKLHGLGVLFECMQLNAIS